MIPKFLQSSAGDGSLSNRVQSILLALLPGLLLFSKYIIGVDITPDEGESLVNFVGELIVHVQAVIAVLWHIKGWAARNFRKENKLGVFASA